MSDFDEFELEFRREINVREGCPPAELLLAYKRGALPDELTETIANHAATCPQCGMLLRDAPEAADGALSPRQQQKIWQTLPRKSRPVHTPRLWWAAALVASCGLLLFAVRMHRVRTSYSEGARNGSHTVLPATTSPAPKWQDVTIAKLQEPTDLGGATLLYRGPAPTEPSQHEAAAGFAAYRGGDYEKAIELFTEEQKKYPASAVLPLYIGVSELFLHRDDAAFRDLERASHYAHASRADDAAWYLAIAAMRLHRADGPAMFANLCRDLASVHHEDACRISKQIE